MRVVIEIGDRKVLSLATRGGGRMQGRRQVGSRAGVSHVKQNQHIAVPHNPPPLFKNWSLPTPLKHAVHSIFWPTSFSSNQRLAIPMNKKVVKEIQVIKVHNILEFIYINNLI